MLWALEPEWAMRLLRDPYVEYDGRKSMRSLADALTKLRAEHHLDEGQTVTIQTMGVRLPDRRLSGFVWVFDPQRSDGARMVIFMPSSARFSGRDTLGGNHTYMISELDNATSDSDGNVQLADGRFLHAIELIPAPAHYDFGLTEHRIVQAALSFTDLGHQCYRALDEELLPGLKVLDYAEVAKVRIRSLKSVVRHVINLLPDVSDRQITETLKRAGVQLPRSRPRGSGP